MSPMLVVAYALAGRIDIDFESEPLGTDATGKAVFLRDIWPKDDDIQAVMDATITAEMFRERYKEAFSGSAAWQAIEVPKTAGGLYAWKDERGDSFVQQPPFFDGMKRELSPISSISGARCLAAFGDDVTTDHISPAANIPKESELYAV